jgi:hypothetical protein
VSLPSSYRSRRGHIHLPRVLPLVGCRSKTPTGTERESSGVGSFNLDFASFGLDFSTVSASFDLDKVLFAAVAAPWDRIGGSGGPFFPRSAAPSPRVRLGYASCHATMADSPMSSSLGGHELRQLGRLAASEVLVARRPCPGCLHPPGAAGSSVAEAGGCWVSRQ